MTVETAAAESRSVATAAASLLRSVQGRGGDLDNALDRLELQARRAIESPPVQGFDAAAPDTVTDEDVMADALSQLSIGLTLVSAEAAVNQEEGVPHLDDAVSSLEATATVIESGGAAQAAVLGFDTAPDGVLLSLQDAAIQSLDEMSAAATDVATAILDKARKPLMKAVPEQLRDPITTYADEVGGRLLRWGLRAVRKGLDLLLGLVDLALVERARDTIDQILAGLERDEDAETLMAFAIGAQAVRADLQRPADPSSEEAHRRLVTDLAGLADRFARLCVVLRRIASVIAGLTGVLLVVPIAVPHATPLTVAGLCIVLGAVVVLGRDYTGATDLPGRVLGVRLLVAGGPSGP